jgi:thioredoxin reductase (NADPH)
METEVHDEAVARGKLRYCPICDGYEVSGQGVAVIGTGQHAANEAVFLRAFTRRIVLLAPDGAHQLEQGTRRDLQAAGIELLDGPVSGFALEAGQITFQSGALRLGADSVYLALGSVVRSELAGSLGVERSDEGCIKVDSHQRTCVPGLYAAGDVVLGLDQISIAVGEAALAATTIRNDLHDRGRRLP